MDRHPSSSSSHHNIPISLQPPPQSSRSKNNHQDPGRSKQRDTLSPNGQYVRERRPSRDRSSQNVDNINLPYGVPRVDISQSGSRNNLDRKIEPSSSSVDFPSQKALPQRPSDSYSYDNLRELDYQDGRHRRSARDVRIDSSRESIRTPSRHPSSVSQSEVRFEDDSHLLSNKNNTQRSTSKHLENSSNLKRRGSHSQDPERASHKRKEPETRLDKPNSHPRPHRDRHRKSDQDRYRESPTDYAQSPTSQTHSPVDSSSISVSQSKSAQRYTSPSMPEFMTPSQSHTNQPYPSTTYDNEDINLNPTLEDKHSTRARSNSRRSSSKEGIYIDENRNLTISGETIGQRGHSDELRSGRRRSSDLRESSRKVRRESECTEAEGYSHPPGGKHRRKQREGIGQEDDDNGQYEGAGIPTQRKQNAKGTRPRPDEVTSFAYSQSPDCP